MHAATIYGYSYKGMLNKSIPLAVQYIAVKLVKVDRNKSTLLLEPNPRLVNLLCIEYSVLEANQECTAIVVVSNSSKISHVLNTGKEIGTVSVVNSLNMNVNSHLQMVSFTELSCADKNLYLLKTMAHLMLLLSTNLPDELILAEDNKTLTIGEQVKRTIFT